MTGKEFNSFNTQEILRDHDIFLGTCSGSILKYKKNFKEKCNVVKNVATNGEISILSWGSNDNEILVAYKNGSLSTYDTIQEKFRELTTWNTSYAVKILPYSSDVLVVKKDGKLLYYQSDSKELDIIIDNTDTTQTFEDACFVPQKYSLIALGGVNNDLKIYDIAAKKVHFQAKNERHDNLNLRQPVSISGIEFVDTNMICSVTKEGKVRVHDPRAQRRAVMQFNNEKDLPCYTCISNCDQPYRLLIGTNRGAVQAVDIRKSIIPAKATKLSMGAVTKIIGGTDSYAFAYSIDRYLWIINTDTLQSYHKDYLKIQATSMVVRPVFKEEVEDEQDEDIEIPVKRRKNNE